MKRAWLAKHPTTVVFALASILGLVLLPGVPWTDDARFYVPAAQSYTEWLLRVLSFDTSAWSARAIDAAFGVNREHPPVAKYVMGLGWLVLHKWTRLLDAVSAARVPVVLLWAWTTALVFRLLDARVSRASAIVGALVFVTLPRVLFDAHAETLDLPVTAFIVATSEAFLRSLETPKLRTFIVTTLFGALALGTKLNAPFAFVAMALFALVWAPPKRDGLYLRLAPIPWSIVGLALVAPLLVWLAWPWLWLDTSTRLANYIQFHLRHYPILFYFAGTLYKEQLAPWTAPWTMLAITTPLPVLVLAGLGVTELPRIRHGLRNDATARLLVFALCLALAQLVAVSLPNAPVYGGIKLFLACTPFLAVIAGIGFETARQQIAERWPRFGVAALATLVLLPGALGVIAYRGAWLSYYSEAIGGVRGAVSRGYETQYYDLAYPAIAEALAQALPNGGNVAVLPNPKEYTSYLARWQAEGDLPRGIRMTAPEQAQVLVLTHERRWPQYPELMSQYRARPLIYRHEVNGVPLFSVYRLR